ncbi:Fur family transcriptional regulator [Kocuria sp.]|uniref:Fur family transcriptional regulator n=1 Tax=Kocuria sp. TaxID=1871328 RepID=UPI0026DBF521|nr:Fur family transcriptional regulator [Kocuria sp.]MDO4918375.1 Fur family transcriptional regulator [Kocuria sp.]
METTVEPAPHPSRDEWSSHLRSHGRRVTRQRLAVLDAVESVPHATAEDTVRQVRSVLPNMSVQSVYVVLADLAAIGMVSKFEPPGSPARYEIRTGDNHHHAYCIRCGVVEDVPCTVGHAPCLVPSEDHGFQLLSAEVVFRGICPRCQQDTAEQSATVQ